MYDDSPVSCGPVWFSRGARPVTYPASQPCCLFPQDNDKLGKFKPDLGLPLASVLGRVFTLRSATGMSEPNAKSSAPDKGASGQIFVVDDEAMLLELATVILQPLNFQIRTFRDPAAALVAFKVSQPRPVLVITDYAMHSMNGMALIEACRRIEPQQKVLLISGTVGEDIYYNSPVKPDAFLGKPYHARQLVELVEFMLAR